MIDSGLILADSVLMAGGATCLPFAALLLFAAIGGLIAKRFEKD